MKKKSLVFICLLLFSAGLIFAAGTQDSTGITGDSDTIGGELVLLNWLGGSERDALVEIEEAFMVKYPEITIKDVNTSAGGADARSGIKTALLAGDKFDLILNTWPSLETELRDQGMLISIDEYWESYNWQHYLNNSWRNLASADGKTWSVYFIAGNRSGLWYSTETMEAAGMTKEPETWDELMVLAKSLKNNDIMPFAIGAKSWAQTEWFENLLLKLGGPDAARQLAARDISWTDPVVIEVFKYWKELIDSAYVDDAPTMFSNHWDTATDAVLRQRTAGMTLMGAWINNRAKSEYMLTAETDYNFIPFPAINKKYAKAMSIDGKSWMMMENGKNHDAAALFLDFVLSAEGSDLLAKHNLTTPSSSVSLESYDLISKKSTKLFVESDVFFVLDDMLPSEMSAEFRAGLQEFLVDPSDESVKKITENLEAKAKEIY